VDDNVVEVFMHISFLVGINYYFNARRCMFGKSFNNGCTKRDFIALL